MQTQHAELKSMVQNAIVVPIRKRWPNHTSHDNLDLQQANKSAEVFGCTRTALYHKAYHARKTRI